VRDCLDNAMKLGVIVRNKTIRQTIHKQLFIYLFFWNNTLNLPPETGEYIRNQK